jgi:hypothetical protein
MDDETSGRDESCFGDASKPERLMTSQIRYLKGVAFRQFRTIFPGETLFMLSGRVIAVEHWAYEPGQHEFDYQVNSRQIEASGRPQAIMTTRAALEREFMERRAVSRAVVPVSIGDSNGNRIPEVRMTYGEVAPQIYTSTVNSDRVGWSLSFRSHRHVSTQGTLGTAKSIAKPNASIQSSANRSARAQNMQSGFNYLMLWIPESQFGQTRILENGFGVTDMIGTDISLTQRMINWVTGR